MSPGSGSAGPGARCRRHRALAQAHLVDPKEDARREGRLIVFVDESGLSQRPPRVCTWAAKGETPVIQFHISWHQLSLIAAMHFNCACFRLHEGTIAKEQVVESLNALLAHWRRRLLALWYGMQRHRGKLVRNYDASTGGRLKLHFLLVYAPALNPVEFLWAWLKRHALANYCPDTFAELRHTARGRLKSAQRRSVIIAACW